MLHGIFGCVPEETHMSTFQVILLGGRLQALKVSPMSFIVCFFWSTGVFCSQIKERQPIDHRQTRYPVKT